MRDPGERSLYDPSTRQDPEASRRHQPLPIHLLALLGPLLLCPHHLGQLLLGNRLWGLARTTSTLKSPGPPRPTSCPSLGSRHIDPQMLQAGATAWPSPTPAVATSSHPGVGHLSTVCTLALSTIPSVSTSSGGAFCLRPSLGGVEAAALVASYSRGPDRLGVHNACAGVRVSAKVPPCRRSRSSAFRGSHVPSSLHRLKQS
jgi:hypothetical protein